MEKGESDTSMYRGLYKDMKPKPGLGSSPLLCMRPKEAALETLTI